MIINSSCAVIDNDFINHLVETHLPENELIDSINSAFSGLNLRAVVHPLVYDKEIKIIKNKIRKVLFSRKIIEKAKFSDIHQNNEAKKLYYSMLVKEGLKFLNGNLKTNYDAIDVFSDWEYQKSFGEVHSTAMCIICDCKMFLSDDDDSIKLVDEIKRKYNIDIQVYNRKAFLEKHKEEGKTTISSTIRKRMAHKRCN